jgi:hypothetical protein
MFSPSQHFIYYVTIYINKGETNEYSYAVPIKAQKLYQNKTFCPFFNFIRI